MTSCGALLFAIVLNSVASVQFDIQPMVPAVALPKEAMPPQMPGSRFVQVSIDISTIVSPDFQGAFDESMFKVLTRKPAVQIADYWPRTEMYTSITTPLSISEEQDRLRQGSIEGAGGYPGAGAVQGQAYFHDKLNRDVRYQKMPPMHLLTASGTIDRGSGVYFKLRSTPQAALEGARKFVITLEVPNAWRSDVLEVQAIAYGRAKADSGERRKEIGQGRFLVAVYQDGDREAAEYAMTFVEQQSRLRSIANQYTESIEKRAYPTPVHKLGQALDMYAPLVPVDYLEEWIFGSVTNQPNPRLPVDLRVAMLDYIDSRDLVERMAIPSATAPKQSIARHYNTQHELRRQ